jgi:hypothetical protein
MALSSNDIRPVSANIDPSAAVNAMLWSSRKQSVKADVNDPSSPCGLEIIEKYNLFHSMAGVNTDIPVDRLRSFVDAAQDSG